MNSTTVWECVGKSFTYFFKESVLESLIKDCITLLCISFSMYVNYVFCGNSKIMSGFFIYLIVSKAWNFAKKRTYTLEEAEIEIQELKNKLKQGGDDEKE